MAYVREVAETVVQEDTTGNFNPMFWLDLELEDNPNSFDLFLIPSGTSYQTRKREPA